MTLEPEILNRSNTLYRLKPGLLKDSSSETLDAHLRTLTNDEHKKHL